MSLTKVAIIGTGITALSIGYHLPLVNPAVEITFFDKGQKPGGRVATRRSRQNQQLLFDHGAPFLWEDNIKGDFRKVLQDLNAIKQIKANFAKVDSLNAKNIHSAYTKNVLIGKNGLDSIPETIFKSIKNVNRAHFEHRVTQILTTKQNEFNLRFEEVPNKVEAGKQVGPFNQVFCCIPYPQAKSIKQDKLEFQADNKAESSYDAHWIILVSVKQGQIFPHQKDTDVIEFKSGSKSPIKYAVKQNKKFAKLQGSETQNWALYFSEKWTSQNLNLTKEQVQEKFIKQMWPQLIADAKIKPEFITVHRWLYSSPKLVEQIKEPITSKDGRLVFAGDWVGNRQRVGECWTLGKEIVHNIYAPNLNTSAGQNKSKL